MIIIDEHKKDDKVDADKDGIADASQTTGKELIQRKVKLVLTKINPEKVNDAIASIYITNISPTRLLSTSSNINCISHLVSHFRYQYMFIVWMIVLAVLTIQFARTIAMALTISEFIQKFVNRFLLPIVKAVVPKEYQVSVLIFE